MPPAAPMVMPVRMIAGDVAAWEVRRLGARSPSPRASALVALAARIYGAAVLRTGARVSLRSMWRSTAAGEGRG